eukprot:TRINITY_DN12312_c0_g1_i1.p1 TRINITY_DN12312_c0_g1~~TRINITY_DN12312_c0_g1_i1.p1  ORF type:complete len:336 (-),score=72.19 TRINITY_DN12312_c0_g1_i1:117-1124(-)
MAFLIPVGVAIIAGGIKGIGKISQAVNHGKTRSNHEEDGPAIVNEQGFLGGWLSKRAIDKTKKGKSEYTKNYSWKPRYVRQTETGSLAYCVDKDPSKPPKGEIKLADIKYVFPRKDSDRFVIVTVSAQGTYQTMQLRTPTNELRDIWLCNLIIRLPAYQGNPELVTAAKTFLTTATPEEIKHGFLWYKFLDDNGLVATMEEEEEDFGDDDGGYSGGSSSSYGGDSGGGSSSTSVASPRGGGGGGGSGGGGNNDAAMRQYQQRLKEWEASTRERCFGCKGQGFHKCTSCKGSGRNTSGKPCSSCSGKGQFNCLKCSSHKGLQYGPKGKFAKPQPPK